MREKARTTLDRMKRLQNTRKKYVPSHYIDKDTWTAVPVRRFEDRYSSSERSNYIQILAWTKANCKHAYARDGDEFWFENGKDAFVFRLNWG